MRVDFTLEDFERSSLLETCRQALQAGLHVQVRCLLYDGGAGERQRALELLEQLGRELGRVAEILNPPRLVAGGVKMLLVSGSRVRRARREQERSGREWAGRPIGKLGSRQTGKRRISKVRLHLGIEEPELSRRLELARAYLQGGNLVKFVCVFGEPRASRADEAGDLLLRIARLLAGHSVVVEQPAGLGYRLFMVLMPI